MNSLRMLAFLVFGAIAFSAAFAFTAGDGDNHTTISFDDDDGGHMARHTISGNRGEFLLRDDDRKLKAVWRGEFKLNEAGDALAEIDDVLTIEIREDGDKERIEYGQDGDKLVADYYIDGEKQADSAEKDAAVQALFLKFLRASGMKSDERVAGLLSKGGVPAVFAELDLVEGGHALRSYTEALTEQTDLSSEELASLVEKLTAIESDHDLSHALGAILENEDVGPESAPILITAAENIESDHDLRQLVQAFAERPLTDDALTLVVGLMSRMDSDHDLRVAAISLFENDGLSLSQVARLLEVTTSEISSDHDIRLLLTESAPKVSQSDAIAAAWMAGFDAIDSSHDQRVSLVELADHGDLDNEGWVAVIEATKKIDSSHDQRIALMSILDHIDDVSEAADAFRNAAEAIASESDRERVLEALAEQLED